MGRSVLLAGGGTAGHVNPLLATAAELRARGHKVAALGTATGLEADLVPRAGVELHTIDPVPFPRRPSLDAFRVPGRLRAAIAQASAAITAVNADAVVGFGGYVSAPAYYAAKRHGVPIVVHEANARPGLANRLGARWAAAIAITFAGTPLRGATLTGLPLREDISQLALALADRESRDHVRSVARTKLGWPADAPGLLVTGGSLGAASLNAAMAAAAADLTSHGLYVLHLTGAGKSGGAEQARGELPAADRGAYVVREYDHDMATAFAAVDAVACRAGAATVSEVSALGIPALYVPLPIGNGEQALNAGSAVAAGAATLIDDGALTPAAFALAVERMVLDPDAASAMRKAAVGAAVHDGAARLADLVEGVFE